MPSDTHQPPPTGTRKLATILAADVAGYSRLMADDDQATVAALQQARTVFREGIEAHSGRLIDTAGDSVLAEFRSVVEAVQCAVEVQEKLKAINAPVAEERRMLFRIGVNFGDIIEEEDGTLYGSGVNVAARLEGLADPGTVAISARVYDDVEERLDIHVVDIGEHEVKNIAKPVKAYRLLTHGETAAVPPGAGNGSRNLAVAALAIVVLIIAGVGWWQSGTAPVPEVEEVAQGELPPLPTGPSIAVLPFDNLNADPEQEYFADGLAEDILTRLAAFLDLKVIARNSSFQYKGAAVDVREVGRELGADYVLEGSVRRDAASIRISAQLLDARDGSHVWTETYDRDLSIGSVFAIQDEITEHVTAAIGGAHGAIAASGIGRLGGAPVGDLRSYECVLLAYQYTGLPTVEIHKTARDCLEEVVVRDPNYVEALA
ncbi:MAG: adenylate/guanylate cyclase domain-containing protein [Alphaproteobacteria bacterium]|jgi:TolB-like protein/class 3 adenylate cyclase|nr:adenylate/guanylate cyclase domain-containing protein [Alphaproteobacteria bacterium]